MPQICTSCNGSTDHRNLDTDVLISELNPTAEVLIREVLVHEDAFGIRTYRT